MKVCLLLKGLLASNLQLATRNSLLWGPRKFMNFMAGNSRGRQSTVDGRGSLVGSQYLVHFNSSYISVVTHVVHTQFRPPHPEEPYHPSLLGRNKNAFHARNMTWLNLFYFAAFNDFTQAPPDLA